MTFVETYKIVQNAEGQLNMDSFSAKGIIFSKLTQSPLLNTQISTTNQSVNTILNNSLNNIQSNTTNNLPILEGGWDLAVRKGEVVFFQVIFSLSQNDKVLNAFAVYNLTTDRYIQLNDKGNEIISGKVDLTSAGLRNETISNIDATITITSLTQLRIFLDNNVVAKYFNNPIIGETRVLADATGNILLGPAPPAMSPSQTPPSPNNSNIPQLNSFSGSTFLYP